MSKPCGRTPVAYRFARVPREFDGSWYDHRVTTYQRGLAVLFFTETDGKPWPCGDHWEAAVCRLLRISGPERPNATRALRAMLDLGLLAIEAGTLRALLEPRSGPTPVASRSDSGPTPFADKRPESFTRRPLDRQTERQKERETDTQTDRVRACVREGSESDDEPMNFAAAVQVRFRKLHLAALDSDPAMGGTAVGTFPERLANTARARSQDPLELLEQAFERWLAGGCEGSKRSTPYAAFVARFDGLVASRSNGRARASPGHEFAGSDLSLLGPAAPGETV